MSAVEADQVIQRAWQHLHGLRSRNPDLAVRLADSVIIACDAAPQTWRAHLVKAEAYTQNGDYRAAARTARNGIQTLLTDSRGALGDEELATMKWLLVAYVAAGARTPNAADVREHIERWRDEVLEHHAGQDPPEPDTSKIVRATFAAIDRMAQEWLASSEAESGIRAAVENVIKLLNRRDRAGLRRAIVDGSPLAAELKRENFTCLPKGVQSLMPASAIDITVSKNAARAAAAMDLLMISVNEDATLAHNVRLQLSRSDDGGWKVSRIQNLPGSYGTDER
jgi:hypothetical protein